MFYLKNLRNLPDLFRYGTWEYEVLQHRAEVYKPEFFINSQILINVNKSLEAMLERRIISDCLILVPFQTTHKTTEHNFHQVWSKAEKKRRQCIACNCYHHIMSLLTGFSYTFICCLNSSCTELSNNRKKLPCLLSQWQTTSRLQVKILSSYRKSQTL